MTSKSRRTRKPSSHEIPSMTAASLGIGVSNRTRPLLSESLAGRIVSVEDPSRLLDSAHALRQLRFQNLVRRYISQIQYGCEEPSCTTPTCLSCRKRDTSKPFKTPTQVTARALAHYLASQDNPHAGLCPNKLNILPSTLEISGKQTRAATGDWADIPYGSTVFGNGRSRSHERIMLQNDLAAPPANGRLDVRSSKPYDSSERPENTYWQDVNRQHQAKKDNKSLGQNLYDTVAVICSFSKHIPSPPESLHSLSKYREDPPLIHRNHTSPASINAKADNSDSVMDHNTSSQSKSSSSIDSQPSCNGHMANGVNGHDSGPAKTGSHTLPILSRHPSKKSPGRSNSHITTEYHPDGQIIRKFTQRIPHYSNGQARTTDHPGLDGAGGTDFAKSSTMGTAKLSNGISIKGGETKDISRAATAVIPDHQRSERDQHLERASDRRKQDRVAVPVTSHLTCAVMDELASHTRDYRSDDGEPSAFSFVVDYDKRARLRPSMPFVNRSLYYSLSDPATLLRSFRDEEWKEGAQSPLPHLNPNRLSHAFRSWNQRNGSLIFDSLWIATEALFNPPPEIVAQKSPRIRAARKAPNVDGFADLLVSPNSDTTKVYLSDLDAAHIAMICIHALTSLVPVGWPHTWAEVRNLRSWGIILPRAPHDVHNHIEYQFKHPWLGIIDGLEYEPALRLADRLVRGIAARRCFSEILKTMSRQAGEQQDSKQSTFGLMDAVVQHLAVVEQQASKSRFNLDTDRDPGWTVTSVFLEWLRTMIIKQWDCKSEVHRWSSVGGAIEIMGDFYEHRDSLNLYSNMFRIHYLHERMDQVNAPTEWLKRSPNPNTLHLLSYPFLFHPQRVVSFFRTVNYRSMYKEYERTERTQHLRRQLHLFYDDRFWFVFEDKLQVLFSRYLVLDVTRADPLKDTFDQLWGLQKRHFMKPLKVKLGHHEGEQGLDQGGVSLEFFQVILAEVFDPNKGMFTVDPTTRMTWFRPGSLEPLYRYELIGLLFSLAIYNGITLPVTFPTAFYRRLLDKPVTAISHIRDGWPELAKGFEQLLSWSDGDVGDVFTRTYSFSFEANGKRIDVDMRASQSDREPCSKEDNNENLTSKPFPTSFSHDGPWQDESEARLLRGNVPPISDSSLPKLIDELDGLLPDEQNEAELVTNANRKQYVDDYIHYLTDYSIRTRFNAFAKGFYTCLDWKAVNIFNEDALKFLVEGHHDIDIAALRAATKYEDGYTASHPTVLAFWDLVETFDLDDKRRLLEFVTASDRVPVGGAAKMQFAIVRSTAPTEQLPTSSTCFGRLNLPEYETREKLEKKLRLALENSKGFGAV
ncbi:uncharacterized protein BDZ99DRAFT_149681 [Mytilinidion resinicola]|uniref:HECT-type E3 ubiquitin transferase n=1 Tax=Mytilinidion resinicola TaxID=574789 RepID=A0A6A6Y7I2_9PEZI|nr:uncharacterized protein BDZ99DRAFT_149681 [Mytilinidion resinicola]KAF2804650.1 hypothetical protein BDZ99DRAFT_149681 [Mytilinidion resinicola]